MPVDPQILKDYVTTAESGKYTSWDDINSKFPELEGYDKQVLKDYVSTASSGKYTSWDEINSKFPEFFQEEVTQVKKKDATASPSGDGLSVYQKISGGKTAISEGLAGKYEDKAPKKKEPAKKADVTKPGLDLGGIQTTEELSKHLAEQSGKTKDEYGGFSEKVFKEVSMDKIGTGKSDDEVVEYLSEKFPELQFSTSSLVKDEITVSTKDGYNSISIPVGGASHEEYMKGAVDRLRNFIQSNTSDERKEAVEAAKAINEVRYGIQEDISKRVEYDLRKKAGLSLPGEGYEPEQRLAGRYKIYEEEQIRENFEKQKAYLSTSIKPHLDEIKKKKQDGKLSPEDEKIALRASIGSYDDRFMEAYNDGVAVKLSDLAKESKHLFDRESKLEKDIEQFNSLYEKVGETEETAMMRSALEAEAESIDSHKALVKGQYMDLDDMYNSLSEAAILISQVKEDEGDLSGAMLNMGAKGFSNILRLGVISKEDQENFMKWVGSSVVTDEWMSSEDRTFMEKLLPSLSESAGVMLSSALGGPASKALSHLGFFAQGYYGLRDELDSNPQFKDLTEDEKTGLSTIYGLTIGFFERVGVTKALQGSKFVDDLAASVIKSTLKTLPKNASKELIELEIKRNVKATAMRVAIRGAGATVTEGATEGTQALAETGIKDLFNAYKDYAYFTDEDGNRIKTFDGFGLSSNVWEDMKEQTLYGMAGGAIFSGIGQSVEGGVSRLTDKGIDNDLAKMIHSIGNDKQFRSLMTNYVKSEILAKRITKEEAKSMLNSYDEMMGRMNKIPKDVNQVVDAFDLLTEKEKLQKEIEGKDKALTSAQQNRINQIDEQLKTISENAVQEQAEVSEVSEEMAEGKPAAEPQVVTEEGKKEVSKPKQGVVFNRENRLQSAAEVKQVERDTQEEYDRISGIADASHNVVNSIEFEGDGVVLHETQESYQEAVAKTEGVAKEKIAEQEAGGRRSAGSFTVDGVIHIDMSNPKADAKTVYHEATHAGLLQKEVAPKAMPEMVQAIKDIVVDQKKEGEDASMLEKLDEFVSQYTDEDGYTDPDRAEEFLSELGGMLSSGEYDALSTSTWQKIAVAINNIVNKYLSKGKWQPFSDRASKQEVVDFMNAMSSKMKRAESIADVKVPGMVKAANQKGITQQNNLEAMGETVESPVQEVTRKKRFGSERVKIEVVYSEQNAIERLKKEGKLSEEADISVIEGKRVATTSPDDMLVGSIVVNGEEVAVGNGGVYFVTKFGDVWASSNGTIAEQIAKRINESFKENGDAGYLLLVKGSDAKLISSPQGATSSLAVIETLLDDNLISLSDFRNAINQTLKDNPKTKAKIKVSGTQSAADLKAAINSLFDDVSKSSFDNRGTLVKSLIANIGKTKSAKQNSKAIQEFFGGDVNKSLSWSKAGVSSKEASTKESIIDLVAGVSREELTKGLNGGDIYAAIEVTEEVQVVKDSHQSYPYHIKTKSGKSPKLILLKNREHGSEVMTDVDGKNSKDLDKSFDGKVLGRASNGYGEGVVNTSNRTKQPSRKKQIVGENAQLKENVRRNLSVARQMEADGEKPKTIYLATGWERGVDNKWRYEIPDLKFKKVIPGAWGSERLFEDVMKNALAGGVGQFRLEKILSNDELFDLYPELKNISLAITHSYKSGFQEMLPKNVDAAVFTDYGIKTIAVRPTKNTELLEATIAHEIQHLIQMKEGFAVGADFNEVGVEKYIKSAGEVEARNVEKRLAMTSEERASTPISETEDVAREDQILLFDKPVSRKKQISGNGKKKGKTSTQKKIDKKTGVSKTFKKVTIASEMSALKTQIKMEARSAKAAAAYEKDMRKLVFELIEDKFKGFTGEIDGRRIKAITGKALTMNLSSPVMAERFIQYVDKVINDANKVQQIKDAEKLQKQIKRLAKGADVQVSSKELALEYAKLDPVMAEDIDEFIAVGNKIKELISKSTAGIKKIDGENAVDANFRSRPAMAPIEAYIDKEQKRAEEILKNTILAGYPEYVEAGIINEGMTYSEMIAKIKEVETNASTAISAELEEELIKTVRKEFEETKEIFDYAVSVAEETLGQELSDQQKEALKALSELDIDDISTIKDALMLRDIMTNFYVNGVTDMMASKAMALIGKKGANEMADIVKRKPGAKKGINDKVSTAERTFMTLFGTLDTAIRNVFGGNMKLMLKFKELSGLDRIENGASRAELEAKKKAKQYDERFKNKKPNGRHFYDATNEIERAIYARLMRNSGGTVQEVSAEFKKNVELEIDSLNYLMREGRHTKAGEQTVEEMNEAELVLEVFERLGIPTDISKAGDLSLLDVDSRVDKINKQAHKFAVEMWAERASEVSDTMQLVYNRKLSRDNNYTHTSWVRKYPSEQDIEAGINNASGAMQGLDDGPSNAPSGALMDANKPARISNTRRLSYAFESAQFNAFEAAMFDVYTAAAVAQFNGFIGSSAARSGKIATLKDMQAINKRVTNFYGRSKGLAMSGKTDVEVLSSWWRKAANGMSRFATSYVLGGPTAVLKQTIPAMSVTAFTAGGSRTVKGMWLQMSQGNKIKKMIEDAGVDLALRGAKSVADVEIGKGQMKKRTVWDRIKKAPGALADFWIEKFLVWSDKGVARSSFMAYYMQSLDQQGVSYKMNDITSLGNKQALEYAKAMTSTYQNASNDKLMGEVFSSQDKNVMFFRKIFLPYASFLMNWKTRTYTDIKAAKNATDRKQRAQAIGGVVGSMSELLVYHGVRATMSYTLWYAAKSLTGWDEEEEDPVVLKKLREEEKEFLKKNGRPMTDEERQSALSGFVWDETVSREFKSFGTSLVTDVISPAPITDDAVKYIVNEYFLTPAQRVVMNSEYEKARDIENESRALDRKPAMSAEEEDEFKKKWERDNLYSLWSGGKDNSSYGMLSIAPKAMSSTWKYIKAGMYGEVEFEDGRVRYLVGKDKELASMLALGQLGSVTLAAPPDLSRNELTKAWKILERSSLSVTQVNEWNALDAFVKKMGLEEVMDNETSSIRAYSNKWYDVLVDNRIDESSHSVPEWYPASVLVSELSKLSNLSPIDIIGKFKKSDLEDVSNISEDFISEQFGDLISEQETKMALYEASKAKASATFKEGLKKAYR